MMYTGEISWLQENAFLMMKVLLMSYWSNMLLWNFLTCVNKIRQGIVLWDNIYIMLCAVTEVNALRFSVGIFQQLPFLKEHLYLHWVFPIKLCMRVMKCFQKRDMWRMNTQNTTLHHLIWKVLSNATSA